MSGWLDKAKEVVFSVVPVTLLVVILQLLLSPLEKIDFFQFLIGSLWIVVGLTFFLLGVDIGVTPFGQHLGELFARSNKLPLVVFAGLALGFFISIAEPDLHVLADQADKMTGGAIDKWMLVLVVSIGLAALIVVGLLRIIFNIPLHKILRVAYALVFLLAIAAPKDILGVAFDASGATTGAMTVPFVLAIAMGIALLKKDSKASEKDSFGLLAIASVGPIMAVLLFRLFLDVPIIGEVAADKISYDNGLLSVFFQTLPQTTMEVMVALSPLAILFIFLQLIGKGFKKRMLIRVVVGFVYAFFGLVIFLTGVYAGFMRVGRTIGGSLVAHQSLWVLLLIAFLLGVVTVLAEPAVHVLTQQIEDVTSGYVRKRAVLVALSLGIGLAIFLSVLRIVIPGLMLWHFLLPGYILAIILSHVAPKIFVGIGFDAGAVASGPMTATFILAYTQGIAQGSEGADVLSDGFGMIAMVAMIPIITLQILGLIYRMKSKKRGVKVYGEH